MSPRIKHVHCPNQDLARFVDFVVFGSECQSLSKSFLLSTQADSDLSACKTAHNMQASSTQLGPAPHQIQAEQA